MPNRPRGRLFVLAAACALFATGAAGQSVPREAMVRGGERLAWDQPLPAGEVRDYLFLVHVDGESTVLPGVSCSSGAPSTLTCSAPLPALPRGTHLVQVSALNGSWESQRSEPIRVVVSPQTSAPAASVAPVFPAAGTPSDDVAPPAPVRAALCSVTGCQELNPLLTRGRPITAVAPTPDGRLLFIEDAREIRILPPAALVAPVALTAADDERFVGLAIAPGFADSHLVYVAAVQQTDPQRRTVTVTRYRELAGVLAQAAVVVSALPLPREGDPLFGVGVQGYLYLSMPAARDGGTAGAYDGALLRFAPDGSAAGTAGGTTPIAGAGPDEPVVLALDPGSGRVWLVGSQGNSAGLAWTTADYDGPPARTPLPDADIDAAAVRSLTFVASSDRRSSLPAIVDSTGRLFLAGDPGRARGVFRLSGQTIRDVVAAQVANALYLVSLSDGPAGPHYSIFRLPVR